MGKRLTEKTDIPVLDDWITLPDAANILNISRQQAHNKAVAEQFKTLHRIGSSTFVVRKSEVEGLTTVNDES